MWIKINSNILQWRDGEWEREIERERGRKANGLEAAEPVAAVIFNDLIWLQTFTKRKLPLGSGVV